MLKKADSMRRLLERPVSVRLSASMHQRYEQAAAERGMSLSAYLRDRLEIDDQMAEHVAQLRLTLMDTPASAHTDIAALPILLELLLLARRNAPPADRRAIHLELQRHGIPAWSPAKASDPPQ